VPFLAIKVTPRRPGAHPEGSLQKTVFHPLRSRTFQIVNCHSHKTESMNKRRRGASHRKPVEGERLAWTDAKRAPVLADLLLTGLPDALCHEIATYAISDFRMTAEEGIFLEICADPRGSISVLSRQFIVGEPYHEWITTFEPVGSGIQVIEDNNDDFGCASWLSIYRWPLECRQTIVLPTGISVLDTDADGACNVYALAQDATGCPLYRFSQSARAWERVATVEPSAWRLFVRNGCVYVLMHRRGSWSIDIYGGDAHQKRRTIHLAMMQWKQAVAVADDGLICVFDAPGARIIGIDPCGLLKWQRPAPTGVERASIAVGYLGIVYLCAGADIHALF